MPRKKSTMFRGVFFRRIMAILVLVWRSGPALTVVALVSLFVVEWASQLAKEPMVEVFADPARWTFRYLCMGWPMLRVICISGCICM